MKTIFKIFCALVLLSCSNTDDSINCGTITGSRYTINDNGVESFVFIVNGENITVTKSEFYGFERGQFYCW